MSIVAATSAITNFFMIAPFVKAVDRLVRTRPVPARARVRAAA
ncbi:MAG: hypothetical protein WAU75_04265 [Solirubrobacteraceae bacterium]